MSQAVDAACLPAVSAEMPVVDVLSRLLDSPSHRLAVRGADDECLGVVDSDSLLQGLSTVIAPRDDSSLVMLECHPSDYSASLMARAVEDADTHLVDLWSTPGDAGKVRVTLRVRTLDPTSVAHSLERYGYEVTGTVSGNSADVLVAAERLMELQALLNV